MRGRATRVRERWVERRVRELGRRVRAARVDADVSPAELAAATGIDLSNLLRLERGLAQGDRFLGPTLRILIRISLALGVPLSELLP